MIREASKPTAAPSDRLVSLDAYRGFTMFLMASAGLALSTVAFQAEKQNLPSHKIWQAIGDQTDHCAWVGCTLWDLIQPSFMFIVGVSMVFSFAIRRSKGQPFARQLVHAVKRAALLCVIGFFLDSYGDAGGTIMIQFIRVLQQIAIGYVIAFLVLPLGWRVQAVTAVLLLIVHSAAYMTYEPKLVGLPSIESDADFGRKLAGENDEDTRDAMVRNRRHLQELIDSAGKLDKRWQPLDNFGRHLDFRMREAVERLLPRDSSDRTPKMFDQIMPLSKGFYNTFNAISAAATILFGVLVGELLRSSASAFRKLNVLLIAGVLGLALGWAISGGGGWLSLEFTPIVPLVKKIWTASFAIFSAGWACLALAFFYAVIDMAGWKAWAFPFVVVGMNSIAMYVISGTMKHNFRIIANMFVPTEAGRNRVGLRFSDLIPTVDLSTWFLTPFIGSSIIMLCFWLCTYWMYRNKMFLKV
jgi:heparan-alpha-glucosaminide N-acetyltransferase